jgi:hypothetical protein
MRLITAALLTVFALAVQFTSAQDCGLIVPNDPLTATGLATPYQLAGADGKPSAICTMADAANAGAFVQGAFIDLDTGIVKVYDPLVIDVGTKPLVAPTAPTLPANSVVALWFGFNGNTLTLMPTAAGNGLTAGNCVNGFGGTVFGQFAYCNAPAFFNAANNAILSGNLIVPPLGTAVDGLPCPTVRDFFVVDQDQSDNVLTSYLIQTNAAGQALVAQDTTANRAANPNAKPVTNASDNRLVNIAINGVLKCTPWTVQNAADPNGAAVGALPLNELFASYRQPAPSALVPENDPMVQLNGASSVDKVNAYRMGVNQPLINNVAQAPAMEYCQKFATAAFNRIQANAAGFQAAPSPAGDGNSLYFFLVTTRFSVSIGPAALGGLGCTTRGVANPFVTPPVGNGVLNQTLLIVLAGTGGALALIGVGAAIFVVAQRRKSAMQAASNFMAL